MRIQLTTIALDMGPGRLFAEGAIVIGRDLAEGDTFAQDEIPMDLAKARVAAGTASLVIDLAEGVSPEFAEALAAYAHALSAVGDAMVVVLDLADVNDSDAEAIAFVDVLRNHNGKMFERLDGRVDGLMLRARAASQAELAKLDLQDLAHEDSKGPPAIDAAASSNGGIEGAAHVTAAPDILTDRDSIDGGQANDLVVGAVGNDSVIEGLAEQPIPENEPPPPVEAAVVAAVETKVAEATAPVVETVIPATPAKKPAAAKAAKKDPK